MRRDQLEHAIKTAWQVTEHPAVVVVGSQSILGTYPEDKLSPEAAMSREVDVLPLADTNQETGRLVDLIEGVAGEYLAHQPMHETSWPARLGSSPESVSGVAVQVVPPLVRQVVAGPAVLDRRGRHTSPLCLVVELRAAR